MRNKGKSCGNDNVKNKSVKPEHSINRIEMLLSQFNGKKNRLKLRRLFDKTKPANGQILQVKKDAKKTMAIALIETEIEKNKQVSQHKATAQREMKME